jgi:hypothetical protein
MVDRSSKDRRPMDEQLLGNFSDLLSFLGFVSERKISLHAIAIIAQRQITYR